MEKKSKLHIGWLVTAMVVVLLIIDQWIKLYIKTHFCLGESVRVTDWFFIDFIENNGMAWGMSFIGKFWLSLVRSVAIIFLVWYLHRIIKQGKHRLVYIFLVALVLAGAIGNMIDSMFYGLMFTASSPYYVAYQVPFGEGYAPFFMGKVVDMFRFPFFTYTWPEWFPIWGGQQGTFFDPVFNFADSCVSVGIIAMLIFCRKELEELGEGKKKSSDKLSSSEKSSSEKSSSEKSSSGKSSEESAQKS
uniref:lipoprotein signal peptidase n=1 Tax=Prevotella sp. TaxID=59823 RepID=UPI003FF07032